MCKSAVNGATRQIVYDILVQNVAEYVNGSLERENIFRENQVFMVIDATAAPAAIPTNLGSTAVRALRLVGRHRAPQIIVSCGPPPRMDLTQPQAPLRQPPSTTPVSPEHCLSLQSLCGGRRRQLHLRLQQHLAWCCDGPYRSNDHNFLREPCKRHLKQGSAHHGVKNRNQCGQNFSRVVGSKLEYDGDDREYDQQK